MVILDVYVKDDLRDGVIDLLLGCGHDNFFLIAAKKYAAKNLLVSSEEKVTGRQNYSVIRVYLRADEAESLGALIKENFKDLKDLSLYIVGCKPL